MQPKVSVQTTNEKYMGDRMKDKKKYMKFSEKLGCIAIYLFVLVMMGLLALSVYQNIINHEKLCSEFEYDRVRESSYTGSDEDRLFCYVSEKYWDGERWQRNKCPISTIKDGTCIWLQEDNE